MRAAVLRDGRMVVRDDVPEPVPASGQVLVEVKACGICGSDLHFASHGADLLALQDEAEGIGPIGAPTIRLDRDVFMGHEFAAEVLEAGPDTPAPPPGSLVTSVPIMVTPTGVDQLAYSNTSIAGYAERMLLFGPLVLAVPNGLDARRAALTEPMAVGLHAVNKSGIGAGDGALVLGCGPVGLAVIAALKLKGIGPIVATDFSPSRRALAAGLGADEVVDPGEEEAFAAWGRAGRAKPVVVFEAIGVPGIIDDALRRAPVGARIVVVGVCMQPDTIRPGFGIMKELSVQFVLGYDPTEFAESLQAIAEGHIDVDPLITGEVGLDGVPGAFADLADPQQHCKILVMP
jgi:threonine dehydrogenase-like Zn-dependent dehydrogenase